MKSRRISKKKQKIIFSIAIAVIVLIISALIAYFAVNGIGKTVIVGVKSQVVVYADDPAEKIQAVLLDGVSASGGKPCDVKVTVLSPSDGKEVQNLTEGEYTLQYYCDRWGVDPVTSVLTVKPADTTPPTITGAVDIEVTVNGTVSYRDGITVTDDFDENVQLQVDSSQVNLAQAGTYPVTYSATDSHGNTSQIAVNVTVKKAPEATSASDAKKPVGNKDGGGEQTQTTKKPTKEKLDELCAGILKDILRGGMTERQKAEAIFNRVRKIKYVNTPDKGDSVENAYIGLSSGRGDCENYSAASAALLTRAGIQCYELQRVGGTSEHFWQIAYVDGGWYHFDPCPTSKDYPIRCFLLTDEEVIAYSNSRTDKPNYYIYDHNACPYQVVQSRNA